MTRSNGVQSYSRNDCFERLNAQLYSYAVPPAVLDRLTSFLSTSIRTLSQSAMLSAYAVGSLGKGDFAAIQCSDEWLPFSDFDFLFLVRTAVPAEFVSVHQLAEKTATLMSTRNRAFHIGLKIRTPGEISRLPTLYRLHWLFHGRLLLGRELRYLWSGSTSVPDLTPYDVLLRRLFYCCIYAPTWAKPDCTSEYLIASKWYSYFVAKASLDLDEFFRAGLGSGSPRDELLLERLWSLCSLCRHFKSLPHLGHPLLDVRKTEDRLRLCLAFLSSVASRRESLPDRGSEFPSLVQDGVAATIEWLQSPSTRTELLRRLKARLVAYVISNCSYEARDHDVHYSRICALN
jgi:hypothetical protein